MPLIIYPNGNGGASLPVFVNGIVVNCAQRGGEISASQSHRLIVTVSGSGTVLVGGEEIDMSPGNGIFIQKNVKYSLVPSSERRHPEDEWIVDLLEFGMSHGGMESELFVSRQCVFFRLHDPAAVTASLRRIHDLVVADEKYGPFLASAELYSLLIELNRETLDVPRLSDKTSPVIDSVIRYIDDNFTKEISLADLCDVAGGISEQYLCRLFKQHTGKRPVEYILSKRISMARSYLEKTDMPISDIAKMTGFNNTSYFYRIFKKFVGLSPLACRQRSPEKTSRLDHRL